MKAKQFTTLLASILACTALTWAGSRPAGASGAPAEPCQQKDASELTVTKSTSAGDGATVFSLTIYPPWTDAGQRAIVFSAGYVSKEGLAGLDTTRVSAAAAAAHPLVATGDRFECVATLHGVASWSDVRTKQDVVLTVGPMK